MKELSLFSGAGGGLLATQHLLGWETIGYVEIDDYCQRILAQRIKDGFLHNAPIFTDIKTFIDSGCCELYKGITDVITAGFPCQPWSHSNRTGKRGQKDDRNLWPETAKCICEIQPRYIFLENVPNLLNHKYVERIFGDLATFRYNARWGVLGSGDIGLECEGKRLWIIAFKANGSMLESVDVFKHIKPYSQETRRRQHSGAICSMLSQDDYSRIKRNLDVVASQMDRLKAIGNGQVPAVAEVAWKVLSGGIS